MEKNESTVETSKQKRATSFSARKTQQRVFLIVILIVPIAKWFFDWFYINGSTIVMAFQDRTGNWSLENFGEVGKMFTDANSSFKVVIKNTLLSFFCVEFIGVPISLVVSYFIYKKIVGYKAFRVIFYLPLIISGVVMVVSFKALISPLGPVTALLKNIGFKLPEEGLLFTKATATPTIIFYIIWTSAAGNILFYSAMGRIPPELIEVGRLEGLQLFKELIYVILPMIWPTFSTMLILDFTGILNAGGPVLLFGLHDVIYMGQAGTLSFWFFSQVYYGGVSGIGTYGIMSCMGLLFTSISVPITLLLRYLVDKMPSAEY